MIYEHDTEFLDLESSGLPRRRVPGVKPGTTKWHNLDYKTEYMDFPFIVSMAWARNDGEVRHYILNPEGREIPKEASDIHGITTEIANKSDKSFYQVINQMTLDFFECEIVVGHGLYFDTSMIKANVLRETEKGNFLKEDNIYECIEDMLHKEKRIDTMRSTAKMCRKWPTLSELHQKLFRKGFDAHDAKSDLEATRRCYEWLLKKGMVPTFDQLKEKAKELEDGE